MSDPRGGFGLIHRCSPGAVREAGLNPTAFAVYAICVIHRDAATYRAYPSGEGIAKILGVSRRLVVGYLADLERVGLLVKTRSGHIGRATCRLVLDFPGQDIAAWAGEDAGLSPQQARLAQNLLSATESGEKPVAQSEKPVAQSEKPAAHDVRSPLLTNTTSEQKKPTPTRSSSSASSEPHGRLEGGQGSPSSAQEKKSQQDADHDPNGLSAAGSIGTFGTPNSAHQIAPPPNGDPPTEEWVWAGETVPDDDPDFLALLAEERIFSPHFDEDDLVAVAKSEVRVRRSRYLSEYEQRAADGDAQEEAA